MQPPANPTSHSGDRFAVSDASVKFFPSQHNSEHNNNDSDIERSVYFLGRALHQYSLLQKERWERERK
jgi:hypothetical protein